MVRLGFLSACLLAVVVPAAGGAQPPAPPTSQDNGQATNPSSDDGTAEASLSTVLNDPDVQADLAANARERGGNHEPGFTCRPKGMIARKLGQRGRADPVANAGSEAPVTGSFGDLPPGDPLPPCDPD